jgi:hypothetical protein
MVCVLAFSLQAQVEKYGAYVGIAAFLGLALLSILYFAQAREVRRLRDWAGRAPERDAELEARVSADAARRSQPEPVRAKPVPPPATAAAAQDTQITAPPVPATAGNGRPPVPVAVPMGPRPAVAAERVAAAVGVAVAAGEDVRADDDADAPELPAPAVTAPAPAPAAAAPPPEAPSTAGGDGDGDGDGTGEAPVAIPRATPRVVPPEPAAKRPPAQPLRQPTRSATVPPRRAGKPPARRPAAAGHRRGILIGVIAGVLVLGAAALAITQLGGGETANVPNTTVPSPNASATATATPGETSAGGPAKAETTVVILNGTTTDGLAGNAKSALEEAGYQPDRVPTVTSSNQTVARSTVYYAPGRRAQAMDVARTLKIDAVQPLDPDTQALAENSTPTPVKADAVVILGADRNP